MSVKKTDPSPMKTEHTNAHPANSLAPALDLLRDVGLDGELCLAGTGLCINDLARESATITLKQETIFYRNLLVLTKDICVGLRLGKTYLPQRYGLFGYALLSAMTGWQALKIATEFGHYLTYTWFRMAYSVKGDNLRFEFADRMAIDADVRNMYFDRDCAAFVITAIEVLRRPVPLNHVWLPHDGHGKRAAYEAHFGCPVTFNHSCAALELHRKIFDDPIPFRDEPTARQLTHQCRLTFLRAQRQGSLVEEVRTLLIGNPGVFPDIQTIADKLKISARTLQRRLADENSSYQTILDEIRFGLAREYLTETALPLYEIAILLGYSEPGNFTHAFKRWSGINPQDFRIKSALD